MESKPNGNKSFLPLTHQENDIPMHHTVEKMKVRINDILVSYTDVGPKDGPVIIFIHGFPFNLSMWNNQANALKGTWRVLAYDIRGHGDSDAGNEKFSIELFASDLIGLMDELKVHKAVLCGLSMGGYIALQAATKYPGRFNGLVLSDTQCIADNPEAKAKRMKTIEHINENGVDEYANTSISNLFAPSSIAAKKEEVAAVKRMIMATSPNTLSSTLMALSERNETCSSLPDIKMPVLILVGREDKITPPAASQFMHQAIAGSSLAILEQAGHVSNMENPIEFNQHLLKFLNRVIQ